MASHCHASRHAQPLAGTWVGDDSVFKKYGEQLGLVGTVARAAGTRVLWY